MSEWVSVKVRLPPIDTAVLVSDINGPYTGLIRIGFYDPDQDSSTGWRDEEYCDISLTHWMPLPNPPETPHG